MTQRLTVRQYGDRVLLIINGALAADLPWEAARNLGMVLRHKAAHAEEYAKPEQIVADQALLMRVGFPVMLSANPAIQSEAAKEAISNRDLRRYLQTGVPSSFAAGTPRLRMRPWKSA